jgi:hypothetical protein
MSNVVEFIIQYAEDCRLREHFIKSYGSILGFAVQLEIMLEDKWIPIRRYDTTHGFVHCDIIHANGQTEKLPIPAANFEEALTIAEHDLRGFWRFYRDGFIKEVKKHGSK